jgi:hypothetical protein
MKAKAEALVQRQLSPVPPVSKRAQTTAIPSNRRRARHTT